MKFECNVTHVPMIKQCKVKTCMWWSTNKLGCMAYPKAPEPDELSDTALARHKGVRVEQIVEWKTSGSQRIEALITLQNLFEWLDQQPKKEWPWHEKTCLPSVMEAVNNVSKQTWPYSVPELHWTPAKVAVTVHKATLLRFNAHVGKQIDWLKLLGLDVNVANTLANIFKTATKDSK